MTKAPQWTFGRFVWHELSTPDMARSQAFYSELLGWKYQSFSGGSDPYHLILVDGAPLGGLVAGDTTQLMAYVSVPDVDAAAAATAAGGGGTVLVHPLEVPGVGRLSVLADAGGAAFSILHNTRGRRPRPAPPDGAVCLAPARVLGRRHPRRHRLLRGGAGLEHQRGRWQRRADRVPRR